MNLTRRTLLAATAGLAGCASAPEIDSGNHLAKTGERGAQSKSAAGWPLWVVRSGKGTVYLTGETPPHRSDWSDPRIEGILPTCAALWTETSQVVRGPIQPLVVRYGLDTKTPLMSRLDAAEKDRLEKAAALSKLPVERLEQLRPWLAAQQLEQACYQATGRTGRSANQVLAAAAVKASVATHSEFPAQDDVITWFGSLPPELDLQRLRETIDDVLTPPTESQRTDDEWARGNATRTASDVARMKHLYPELYQAILVRRNQDWAPRIQAMLRESKPSLVVVGNYHLVGPDSVLVQLQAASLTAKRI